MEKLTLQSYIEPLFAIAVRKCEHITDAEDLVQETILAALTYLSEGKTIEFPEAWLKTVLERKYCDLMRRKYRQSAAQLTDLADAEAAGDLVSNLIRREEEVCVRREVALLSKTYRDIVARYYFYGKSVKEIAEKTGIPEGTVKSRLDVGRRLLMKGITRMDGYSEHSFMPRHLSLNISGVAGKYDAPRCLVPRDDLLAQNLLILAYEKPITVSDLSRALGVAAAYVEPVVNRLVNGELMQRMGDGKVYTDFVIYHAGDHSKYIDEQELFAREHADAFCIPAQKALEKLRQTPFYSLRLERFLLIAIAEGAVWQSMDGCRVQAVFPDRKDGGKWVAFATLVHPDETADEKLLHASRYTLYGRRDTVIERYLDGKNLLMCNFETMLYPEPKFSGLDFRTVRECEEQMLRLFYVVAKNIDPLSVGVDPRMMAAIPLLTKRGFLAEEDGRPKLCIPHLTRSEFTEFCAIFHTAKTEVARALSAPMAAFLRDHRKKIPSHLKSVPEQKLTMPYEPQPMMFVAEAIRRGLHPQDLGEPCPETIVVFD